MENKSIKCGKLTISNKSTFTLIAGPCQLESEEHALEMASKLKEITVSLLMTSRKPDGNVNNTIVKIRKSVTVSGYILSIVNVNLSTKTSF